MTDNIGRKKEFRIKKNKDWNEYVVEVRLNGKLVELECYYTSDLEDAIDTMDSMVAEALKNGLIPIKRYQH